MPKLRRLDRIRRCFGPGCSIRHGFEGFSGRLVVRVDVESGPKAKAAFDALVEYVDEQGATRAISEMWLDKILAGDFAYFRAYLERCDGKVPTSRN